MSMLSISFGLTPFIKPVGRARKIQAPEMLTDAKGNAIKKSYFGMSGAEIAKLIRKNIIAELASGKSYTAAEMAHDVDASVSAVRIHFVALAKLGEVDISTIVVNWVRAYSYAKAKKAAA